MFAGRENREREREREREKCVGGGKERDRLNFLHKDKLTIQRKSDISSSSKKNGKNRTYYNI